MKIKGTNLNTKTKNNHGNLTHTATEKSSIVHTPREVPAGTLGASVANSGSICVQFTVTHIVSTL